jgi:PAS domain S-box-containing protein
MLEFLRKLLRGRLAEPTTGELSLQGAIAGRRQSEAALRESEEHFAHLVAGVRDYAVFLLDEQGHILTWNAGAERIKGYKAEEIIGKHFSTFYPQEAIDRGWPAHELRVARQEGRFEDEGWRVRKDGSQFWANVVITALYDGAGNFRGFSKVTRDLTERKRAEENARRLAEETAARRVAEADAQLIQEQRERLRVTLTSIGDAVISTDAQGRVEFLNPVAEALVGWKAEEAAHRALGDVFRIVNETTRQAVENPALRALQGGTVVGLANHTILISKEGAERPIDDSAAPIRDAAGKVVGSVLVFRDISERRRAQERLREQQEWLRVTLASIGDAVIATDTQGQVTFLNPVAERLTGWSQAEARGQPLEAVFAILHEKTRRPVENPVEKVLRDGAIVGLGNHTVLTARDGMERPIDDSAAPIRDAAGGLVGVVLTFRDVTDQRRADQYRAARLAATHALNQAATVAAGAGGVVRAVCENLAWDVGFVWTVDEGGTRLVCRQGWHRPDVPMGEFETASRSRTFARGEGLPGRVWASGQPAWILNIAEDANCLRRDPAVRCGLRSAFACPVVVGDRTLGVIEFFRRAAALALPSPRYSGERGRG